MRILLTAILTRFTRDQRGVAAIEFALVAPILIVVFTSIATLFVIARDDYRAKRVTFTISDVMSRQSSVDNTALDLMRSLLVYLVGGKSTAALRVTSVVRSGDKLTVEWSRAYTPYVQMTDGTIPNSKLPEIANGESIVVVETQIPYSPILTVLGLEASKYQSLAAVRPRFSAHVTKK